MCCISGKTFRPKTKSKKETIMEKEKKLISRLYRESKDKDNQLSILAQLYCKNKPDMARFLRDVCNYDDQTIRSWVNK